MAGTRKADIQALLQHNRFADAKRLCESLCKKNCNDAEAWFMMGSIYAHTGEANKAIKALRRSINLHAGIAATHFNLGLVHLQRNQLKAAEKCFSTTLQLDPRHTDARNWLAQLMQGKGAHEDAIHHFREALRQHPERYDILFSLGNSLRASGKLNEAEAIYRQVMHTAPAPAAAGAANNLGLTLYEKGDIEAAMACFRRSLELEPGQTDARLNLAQCHRDQRQIAQAIKILEQALIIAPDKPEIHWDISLLLLQSGQFERGWKEYEWRTRGKGLMLRDFPFPTWRDEELQDKTILVSAEQGIGDEIMFASCFPDLVTAAGHVIIDCEPRLAPLFARSFPTATVYGNRQTDTIDWLTDIPTPDLHVRAGSLPLRFRNRAADFPEHKGYLKASRADIEEWRKRLAALGGTLTVGISWRGGHISQRDRRSTSLAQWAPLIQTPGVTFINLQYGEVEEELTQAEQQFGVTIHHWPDSDPLRDMDHFAAQISAVDLVISVDNSTVHLAGALGVDTLVLQPYAPDWRWQQQQPQSLWYPAVRQIHPETPSDWSTLIARAAAALPRTRPSAIQDT